MIISRDIFQNIFLWDLVIISQDLVIISWDIVNKLSILNICIYCNISWNYYEILWNYYKISWKYREITTRSSDKILQKLLRDFLFFSVTLMFFCMFHWNPTYLLIRKRLKLNKNTHSIEDKYSSMMYNYLLYMNLQSPL